MLRTLGKMVAKTKGKQGHEKINKNHGS